MYTLKQFLADYPDDDTCLEEIKQRKFSNYACKCGRVDKLTRIKGRKSYACICGHQVSPLAGTIFEKSSTPLTTWYFVIWRMSQSKSGVSASQIQRELGVSYKCAWRMCHQIRSLMVNTEKLSGNIQVDETFVAPKPWRNTRVPRGQWSKTEVVLGMVDENGEVRVQHIPNTGGKTINNAIVNHVELGSHINTDGGPAYNSTTKYGYTHTALVHWQKSPGSGFSEFIANAEANTQKIENFFGQFKRGMMGIYRHCEPKYLPAYAQEYAFRYKKEPELLFRTLLERI